LVGRSVGWSHGSHMNVMLPLQFRHPGPPFLTLLRPAGHPQSRLKFWLIGRLVSRLVSRSGGSHTNVTLPLPFRHPGLSFPTLLCPAGHPQNGLKFWSVGRSQGSHTNVTLPLQFHHPGPHPSRPFYALRATPKMALNFGWLIGRSVRRSRGSHTNVTLHLQFCHPGSSFPTLLRPAGHPQNGLKFWLIGRSVSRLVTWKSHKHHAASSVSSPGPALPDPSTPCRPPPKRP
jgi:hypothetical protein